MVLRSLAQFPLRERFSLHIYGQIAAELHLNEMIHKLGLTNEVFVHGFVPEEELEAALTTCDLAINLRYPTMGEASVSQLRIWDHALPSLITPVGWYGQIPEDAAGYVRPDYEMEDIHYHLRSFLSNPDRYAEMGWNGYQQLKEQHHPENYSQSVAELGEAVKDFAGKGIVFTLAERVGAELSLWYGSEIGEKESLVRKAALQILALNSGTRKPSSAISNLGATRKFATP